MDGAYLQKCLQELEPIKAKYKEKMKNHFPVVYAVEADARWFEGVLDRLAVVASLRPAKAAGTPERSTKYCFIAISLVLPPPGRYYGKVILKPVAGAGAVNRGARGLHLSKLKLRPEIGALHRNQHRSAGGARDSIRRRARAWLSSQGASLACSIELGL